VVGYSRRNPSRKERDTYEKELREAPFMQDLGTDAISNRKEENYQGKAGSLNQSSVRTRSTKKRKKEALR